MTIVTTQLCTPDAALKITYAHSTFNQCMCMCTILQRNLEHKECPNSQYKHQSTICCSNSQYIHLLRQSVYKLMCSVTFDPSLWLYVHKYVSITVCDYSKFEIWWSCGELLVCL